MFSLLDSGPSRGELRFRLFGVQVRIQPWFWFTTLIMGASRDTGSILVWIGVVFVSILLHELGHVVAFRLFGVRASVVLYGMGGLAVPETELRGALGRIVVPAAGPIAGFVFAAGILAAVALAGGVIAFPAAAWLPQAYSPYWNIALNDLLFVNIFWGALNLLPIYPLDGGQLARAIFDKHDPVRGKRRSLVLSAVIGGVMAVLAFLSGSMYLVGLFGILAATSLTSLDEYHSIFRASQARR
jgi:stage IV sporulation protein FB